MGLGASLITFTASSLIRSGDINSNFNSLNNSSAFNGGVPTMAFDSGKLLSDGNGNIQIQGATLGKTTTGDMLNANGGILALQATTAIVFLVGGSASTPPVAIAKIISTGPQMLNGGLELQKGSISRDSSFTGNGSGTYNHGLGAVPNLCFPVNTSGSNNWYGASSFTTTTVYVNGTLAFTAFCAAF